MEDQDRGDEDAEMDVDIENFEANSVRRRQNGIETVLSVVWGGGKLGAAYYNILTSELFLLPDTPEVAPDFEVFRALFRQVNPRIIVGCARQDAKFLALLKQLSGDAFPETQTDQSVSTQSSTTTGRTQSLTREGQNITPNLFIQSGKEFAPDSCKQRLQELHLPEEPRSDNPQEHLHFVRSLIPFSNIGMVRAAGALLKFLDKRGLELAQLDMLTGKTPVVDVKICTMTDLVIVDYTAWDSLQIFNQDAHPVAVGKSSIFTGAGDNEGICLYNVLNRCLTHQGSNFLRLQLLRPTRSFAVLNRRHDVIQHCASITQAGLVESVTNSLKGVSNLPKLLQRLTCLHPTVKDWKLLYNTVQSCAVIGEVCSNQPTSIQLFKEISDLCKQNTALASVTREISKVIDFEQSAVNGRFYPQDGLNPALDEKRAQYSTLQEVLTTLANEEFKILPEVIDQCSIIYIPEVGYLLSVRLWSQNLTPEDMVFEGLDYRFTCSDSAYYENSRTRELDSLLGDARVMILELENYIKLTLIDNVLRYSSTLLKIGGLIAELDSLLALSAVARENNYVRPMIVSGLEKLQIVNGRHPLVELNSDFVVNSTSFTEEEAIVILTGPNASGKSIYLKQVGIIVIMALAGSFVPASSATVPAFDRICTRIYAQESVSVGLSTFMIDINQMSLALRNATGASLIIVDEFGKGTAEADGLSLLQATLEYFAEKGSGSPTMFVSTHYNSLLNRLPRIPIFKPQTMEFLMERDKLVHLFKLKEGRCESSFACMVAADTGTPPETIARTQEIQHILDRDESGRGMRAEHFDHQKESLMLGVAESFMSLNLTEINPKEYLQTIFKLLHPFMTPPNTSEQVPKAPPVFVDDGDGDDRSDERQEVISTGSDITSVSRRGQEGQGEPSPPLNAPVTPMSVNFMNLPPPFTGDSSITDFFS